MKGRPLTNSFLCNVRVLMIEQLWSITANTPLPIGAHPGDRQFTDRTAGGRFPLFWTYGETPFFNDVISDAPIMG